MGTKNETYHGVFSFWVEFCGVCICKRKANTCLILNRNGLGRCFFSHAEAPLEKHNYPSIPERCGQTRTPPAACPNIPLHTTRAALMKRYDTKHFQDYGLTERCLYGYHQKNNFFLVSDGCR